MNNLYRLGLAALCLAAPAVAQEPICAGRAETVAHLEAKYGEAPQFAGLDAAGNLIETWANASTGTWSILLSRPDGETCFIGAGTDWHLAAPQPGDPA